MGQEQAPRSKPFEPPAPGAGPVELQPPTVGEVAPDFELPDSTGRRRRLAELAGERPQVLLFFRGHW